QVQANPGDERARIQLASALAAKHGIVMTKFANFARVLIDWKNNSSADTGAPGSFAAMKAMAGQNDGVIKDVQALPAIKTQDELNDIGYAIYMLDGVKLNAGGYYYRALLKLVLYKHNLEKVWVLNSTPDCDVLPEDLKQWVQNMSTNLNDII